MIRTLLLISILLFYLGVKKVRAWDKGRKKLKWCRKCGVFGRNCGKYYTGHTYWPSHDFLGLYWEY